MVGIFLTELTWPMNERAWPPQKINTFRRCWKLKLITMIISVNHFPMRILDKLYVNSWWKRKKKKETLILGVNNVTMYTLYQSPVTINTQRYNANEIFTSERQNILNMLAETLKGLTLDSTSNDSEYYT